MAIRTSSSAARSSSYSKPSILKTSSASRSSSVSRTSTPAQMVRLIHPLDKYEEW